MLHSMYIYFFFSLINACIYFRFRLFAPNSAHFNERNRKAKNKLLTPQAAGFTSPTYPSRSNLLGETPDAEQQQLDRAAPKIGQPAYLTTFPRDKRERKAG